MTPTEKINYNNEKIYHYFPCFMTSVETITLEGFPNFIFENLLNIKFSILGAGGNTKMNETLLLSSRV